MSRQFRSDDTSKWLEGFGNGGAGSATLSGTYGGGTGGYVGACSGTSGQYTLTTPAGWGVGYGGWVCVIHQTQGTGAGAWELNRIMSINSTTSTLKYPLQNTYGTGAQCVLGVPYKNITISGTLTAPAWDGTTGGIIFLLDQGTTTIGGTVTAVGKGFRGGDGVYGSARNDGKTGESYANGTYNVQTTNANYGAGGGGGKYNYTEGGASGAGGPGHANAGTAGGATPGGVGGAAGASYGAASLTTMFLGSGGSSGGSRDYNPPARTGNGGYGGGIFLCLSRFFTSTGTISLNGSNAENDATGAGGASSGGSGGSFLLKTVVATALGTVTANGGAAGTGSGGGAGCGESSVGRIHLDYVVSYSGSTTPTIDVTQDLTLRQPLINRRILF